jgi:hypothetical protein
VVVITKHEAEWLLSKKQFTIKEYMEEMQVSRRSAKWRMDTLKAGQMIAYIPMWRSWIAMSAPLRAALDALPKDAPPRGDIQHKRYRDIRYVGMPHRMLGVLDIAVGMTWDKQYEVILPGAIVIAPPQLSAFGFVGTLPLDQIMRTPNDGS